MKEQLPQRTPQLSFIHRSIHTAVGRSYPLTCWLHGSQVFRSSFGSMSPPGLCLGLATGFPKRFAKRSVALEFWLVPVRQGDLGRQRRPSREKRWKVFWRKNCTWAIHGAWVKPFLTACVCSSFYWGHVHRSQSSPGGEFTESNRTRTPMPGREGVLPKRVYTNAYQVQAFPLVFRLLHLCFSTRNHTFSFSMPSCRPPILAVCQGHLGQCGRNVLPEAESVNRF